MDDEYKKKMDTLREFSDLQGECSRKAALYRTREVPDLAGRFERASLAATSARMLIQAALMAEREAPLQSAVTSRYDTRSRLGDRGT